MYLALVVEINTIYYFLLYQETTTPLKKKQCPISDFLSLKLPV